VLPVLEGIIARRILINFRADPALVARLVPPPLEVVIHRGFAVVGVCLIRLEQLRPKGLPGALGVSSENMAHRIAIRFPDKGQMKEGVFIWRRDTDQKLMSLLGGRLFPGVHHAAHFNVEEGSNSLHMRIETKDHEADVHFQAHTAVPWKNTELFHTFNEATEFFKKGDCGFSCSLHEGELEGMRLNTLKWAMEPLDVQEVRADFYQNLAGAAQPGIEFDCALLMRGIPHEWHEMTSVPELATKRTVVGGQP
jgi:hypothetical protein